MNAEHADLEARFAAPAERDLPPGRHDLHREILINHMLTRPPASKTTRHGGSRSWRPPARVLAAVAAAAVAAGAAGYAITAAKTPAARPPVANRPTTSRAHPGQAAQQAVLAAKVLRAAAAHVAREGVTSEPSPGQWIYYKTVRLRLPRPRRSLRGRDRRGVDHLRRQPDRVLPERPDHHAHVPDAPAGSRRKAVGRVEHRRLAKDRLRRARLPPH